VSEPLVIIDTGPLVALIRQADANHEWAAITTRKLSAPFVTSESVISETCFLLARNHEPANRVFEFFRRDSIIAAFDLQTEWTNVATLMNRYAKMPDNRRMSLADATLVRLAELYDHAAVFTVDSDFRIYRKHGRRQIPLIIPDSV
jgi:uncharacterized protein